MGAWIYSFKLLIMKYFTLILWISFNTTMFYFCYWPYKHLPRHYYLHAMLGIGLCLSRGTAAVLNVNCALLLIPECKNFGLLLRKCPFIFRWIWGKSNSAHQYCVHSGAHIINAVNFSGNFNNVYPELNAALYPGQNPVEIIFNSVAGATGVLMMIILLILSMSSIPGFRKAHFNCFWYTHHLGFIFFILLMLHPSRGLLKEQTNINDHNPGCDVEKFAFDDENTTMMNCSKPPVFHSIQTTTHLWILTSVALYGMDFVIRLLRRHFVSAVIRKAYLNPNNILCLDIFKEKFVCSPGQYISLQCSAVSCTEWHPFSISKCPSKKQPSFEITMKLNGDWSNSLSELLIQENVTDGNNQKMQFKISVDGPFYSKMEELLTKSYSVIICIAAGIGITPYVSYINYLLEVNCKVNSFPERFHLIWICRESKEFIWLAPLVIKFHDKLWSMNKPDVFEVSLYVTQEFHYHPLLSEQFPLLESRISMGRPDWKYLFTEWISLYRRKKVGIFSCGPNSLHQQLTNYCEKGIEEGCNFSFIYESFS